MRLVRYSLPSPRSAAFAGTRASPWSGLEAEMDRLFAAALFNPEAGPRAWACAVDVYQDREALHLRAELPGFRREDIAVELAEGCLTITATRPATAGEAARSVRRSVSVADDVQTDRITATYEHGVLLVALPKREEAKPRKVTVAVN